MPGLFHKNLLARLIVAVLVTAVVGIVVWTRFRPEPPASETSVVSQSRATPRAIFLIVIDTLRPDILSCYGYPGHETPYIDRLANAGVRFHNAQSVSSWTIPSVGSMLTSLYPTQLGLIEKPVEPGTVLEWNKKRDHVRFTIPLRETTLAETMREGGFHTAAFVNQPGLNVGKGFFQGFDEWFYPSDPNTIESHDPTQPLRGKKWAQFTHRAYEIDRSLVTRFGSWLSGRGNAPLFVWLHLLTPHGPYNPEPPHAPVGKEKHTQNELYLGEVREADSLIGEIVRAIETRMGLEEVLIVFTSDHGEAFLEHDMYGHGHSLHKEVVRVPLIMMGPGLAPGTVVPSSVRLTDLMPTIMQMAGLNALIPPDIQGASLVPVIEGATRDRPVYAEGMLYGSTERSLIARGHKLMYDKQDDSYQLYDLRNDPTESKDLSSHRPEEAQRFRTAMTDIHDRLVADYARRDADSPDSTDAASVEEVQRALRALGYIND